MHPCIYASMHPKDAKDASSVQSKESKGCRFCALHVLCKVTLPRVGSKGCKVTLKRVQHVSVTNDRR